MNDWQAAQQLKFLFSAVKWGGSGDYVLNKCVISEVDAPTTGQTIRPPLAIIRIGTATPDEDRAFLWHQAFPIMLLNAVEGDTFAEKAIIGAHRQSATSSKNRGLLEIQAELFSDLGTLLKNNGVSNIGYEAGAVAVEKVDGLWLVGRIINLELLLGIDPEYPPARKLAAATPGAGVCNLTWVNPGARFDLNGSAVPRGTLVLRRASGATAPTSPTAGTGVSLASNFAESVSDSPGAGQFSYALFAGYDETGDGTVDAYSESVTKTVTVV